MITRFVIVTLFALGFAVPGVAQPPASQLLASQAPASTPSKAESRAQRSFDQFAKRWMGKMATVERDSRRAPDKAGATGPAVKYTGYSPEFTTELKPTGYAQVPWVGVLHYTERLYRCADASLGQCSIASVIPVTEIFRFQNGKWVY